MEGRYILKLNFRQYDNRFYEMRYETDRQIIDRYRHGYNVTDRCILDRKKQVKNQRYIDVCTSIPCEDCFHISLRSYKVYFIIEDVHRMIIKSPPRFQELRI